MQVEQIAVRLRRRTPWEALDLGHAMLRAWAAPAYRAWLATYWLVGLVLIGLCWQRQEIALFILWWLKPVFDRVLLFTFSRSLFRTPTTLGDVRAALPGLLRTGLLSALTLRRLSLARSFLLPVWQLENQRGKEARARSKVLSRRIRGNAVWLTVVCANLSTILALSLVMLVEFFTPRAAVEGFSLADWFNHDLAPSRQFISSLLVLAAESLVEPLYVASGFSLYLHRRSELEGWDIELAFRRLGSRPAAAALRAGFGLLATLAFTATLALTFPQPTLAAEASPAKRTIETVLADPVFGKQTTEKEWRLRETPEQSPENLPGWLRALLEIAEFSSQILKALMWIGGLLLAVWLIYLIVRYRGSWAGARGSRTKPPDFLFGLDVRPDSLPDDVAAAARAALATGRIEAALSLLYRGALVALIHRVRVDFQPGDTEDNCLQRVHGHLDSAANRYFGALLDAWRVSAYAHQPPDLAALEGLCQDWNRHFGPAAGGSAP